MRERRYFYLFLALATAALVAVLVPFLRRNNLLEWDFPGHHAAIWHLKNFLFPWHQGWNPYFYCGSPQGIFYPPLAHYLAALLSFAVGIPAAMKLLVAASILALPATFYAFARRHGLDDLQAAVSALWMTAMLFISGDMLDTWTLGADLRSSLNVGLFANTLSLPVLFGFMALVGTEGGPRRWKGAALLWGVLLLLHPFSSLVAVLYVVALAAVHARPGGLDLPAVRTLARTLAVGTLIGAAWVVPFAAFRSYMNPEYTAARWSTQIEILVFNGLLVALVVFAKLEMRPLVVAYVVLANFILIGNLWKLDLQFTRLTVFVLLFLPVLVVTLLRSRLLLGLVALTAVAVAFVGYRQGGLRPAGVPDFAGLQFGRVPGRVLSVAPLSHLPSFHVHHDLVPLRTGNLSVLGLFIESSLNGRFLANLAKALDPDIYIWGTPTEWGTPRDVSAERFPGYVRERLRLFDIRHVYTDLKLETMLSGLVRSKLYVNSYAAPRPSTTQEAETLRARYNIRDNQVDFFLYDLGEGALAEPLPYLPSAPSGDWKLVSIRWFLETRNVPVFTDRPPPPGARPARPDESVTLEENGHDRIRLDIRAAEDIPVLVKVGYFPNWKLEVNGKPRDVYRAAPNLMLIYGHGRAELEYRRSWLEYAAMLLSLAGLILLVLL